MSPHTSASDLIRTHLARVSRLRAQAQAEGLQAAVDEVKQLQARRFRSTYADFLEHPKFAPATRFFLDELYGVHDFARRDAQFARIAGALERLFPEAVAQLAIDLSETHALTEVLDHQLATHWLHLDAAIPPAERYIVAWRRTDARVSRERQLAVVQHMGLELQRLTRMKTLRFGLRMMRNPAKAAGLDALQHFLESGFDAFAALGDAQPFLDTIRQRESGWVQALFDDDLASCSRRLVAELSRGV
ncbi:MAG: FFLEELY motif protein [Hydrogenophaga sp.]